MSSRLRCPTLFSYITLTSPLTMGNVCLKNIGDIAVRLTVAAAVSCIFLSSLPAAERAAAAITQPTYIPPEGLGRALEALARDRNLQLIYATDDVGDRRTDGAVGNLSSVDALKRILKGTGLSYQFLDDKTVTVQPVIGSGRTSDSGDDARSGAGNGSRLEDLRLAQNSGGMVANSSSVSSDATNSREASDKSPGLEEIVVTAQRREESIDKVPISITALSQKTMDDYHIQSISDLATVVPGLNITPTSIYPDHSDIAIRGIYSTPGGDGLGVAPTTQLYIDETPIAIRELATGFSKSPFPYIFDLDRVEVLRGPQGTLFGASAMGGAIRFITPQPNLAESSGFAKAELSFTDGGTTNYEVGAAYGAPLVSNTAAFRVSAWYQSNGGFIDRADPITGQILARNDNSADAYVVRPAFTWSPIDQLSVTPALFLQHSHSENGNAYYVNGLAAPANGDDHVWGGTRQPFTDDLHVWSLSVKYNAGNLAFVSDTSYLDRTSKSFEDTTNLFEYIFTGCVPQFISAACPQLPTLSSFQVSDQNNSYTHALQQEFRLSSQDASAKFSWIAGAFFDDPCRNLSSSSRET